jgi:hypothetical protein
MAFEVMEGAKQVKLKRIFAGFRTLSCALLCTSAIVASTKLSAQYTYGQPPQPTATIDEVGVNLYTGTFSPSEPKIEIGTGAHLLDFSRMWTKNGWRHSYLMYVSANFDAQSQSDYVANVVAGFQSSTFAITSDSNNQTIYAGEDGTILRQGVSVYSNPNFVWTDKSGNRYIFAESSVPASDMQLSGSYTLLISKIEQTSGVTLDFNYERTVDTTRWPPVTFSRLSSVTSSLGYMAKFLYRDSVYNNVLSDYSRAWRWSDIAQVKLINMAYEKCQTIGNVCNTSMPWPTFDRQISWTGALNDAAPQKIFTETINVSGHPQRTYSIRWDYSPQRNSTYITSVTRAGSPDQVTSVTYDYPNGLGVFGTDPYVSSVNRSGQTLSYSYSSAAAPATDVPPGEYNLYHFFIGPSPIKTIRTDAGNKQHTFYGTSNGELLLDVDEIGRKTRFGYLSNVGPTRWAVKVYYPEGDSFSTTLDSRYNVVSLVRLPKPGSSLSAISRNAVYPATCSNVMTCNRPDSITTGKNDATDYSYEPAHGGTKSETLPPDTNGLRAQVRHTYVQRNAWILSDVSGYEKVVTPVWLIASESKCRTSNPTAVPASPCAAGPSDEVVTTYDYGPDTGPSNLMLRGVTITANGVSLRTCSRYDTQGRKIAETTPNANFPECQ